MWRWIVIGQLGATLYMMGLIWLVQLVHYPLFSLVGSEGYEAYQQAHMRWTSVAVGPPMLIEALTTAWLLFVPHTAIPRWWAWTGAVLLAVVWLSTALLQVPQHDVLLTGFQARSHQILVATNWIRTLVWTARAGLMLWLVWQWIPLAKF